jgi:hypothetical protein
MNGIHLACLGAGLILRGLRIFNNAICKCDAIVREPLAAAPGRCSAVRYVAAGGRPERRLRVSRELNPIGGQRPWFVFLM